VSADGARWFLLNVSPDVREQLATLDEPGGTDTRRSPVAGIIMTDGELDHTIGLMLLRESERLALHVTCAVQTVLERDSRILPVTRAFADVRTVELPLDRPRPLEDVDGRPSGLTIEAFPTPGAPPRFASGDETGHTVGLTITDATTGGRLAFVPGCGDLDPALRARLARHDLVFFDGTFWSDDELVRLGISDRRARAMDHLPISGPGGSLEQLGQLHGVRTVYTHINNTNPILFEQSAERETVMRSGVTIGRDGMAFAL
jgi:pyrroloquinoline quinone biosynthesis protein B